MPVTPPVVPSRPSAPSRRVLRAVALLGALAVPPALAAQGVDGRAGGAEWDVTVPRGKTRTIDFTTTEGTLMSVDVSPDGQWVVFDLLGHVYRMPIGGGVAECLTQGSGIAVNYHPRYSPDGQRIAFISDRRGQDNLWVMDADGRNPRPVALDPRWKMRTPDWTADGQFVILVRGRGRGRGRLDRRGWFGFLPAPGSPTEDHDYKCRSKADHPWQRGASVGFPLLPREFSHSPP